MLKISRIYRANNEISDESVVYLNSILKIYAMPSNSIYDVVAYCNVIRTSKTDCSRVAFNDRVILKIRSWQIRI